MDVFFVFSDGFDTKLSFSQDITYQAENGLPEQSNSIVVRVKKDALTLGVQDDVGKLYDYSTLAQTWSSPRIFRMPNTDAPDDNILDEIVNFLGDDDFCFMARQTFDNEDL